MYILLNIISVFVSILFGYSILIGGLPVPYISSYPPLDFIASRTEINYFNLSIDILTWLVIFIFLAYVYKIYGRKIK